MVSFLICRHQLRCENLKICAGKKYIPKIDFSRPRGKVKNNWGGLVRRAMMLVRSGL